MVSCTKMTRLLLGTIKAVTNEQPTIQLAIPLPSMQFSANFQLTNV